MVISRIMILITICCDIQLHHVNFVSAFHFYITNCILSNAVLSSSFMVFVYWFCFYSWSCLITLGSYELWWTCVFCGSPLKLTRVMQNFYKNTCFILNTELVVRQYQSSPVNDKDYTWTWLLFFFRKLDVSLEFDGIMHCALKQIMI